MGLPVSGLDGLDLHSKVGPMSKGAWILVTGTGLGLGWYLLRKRKAAAAAAVDPTGLSTGDPNATATGGNAATSADGSLYGPGTTHDYANGGVGSMPTTETTTNVTNNYYGGTGKPGATLGPHHPPAHEPKPHHKPKPHRPAPVAHPKAHTHAVHQPTTRDTGHPRPKPSGEMSV